MPRSYNFITQVNFTTDSSVHVNKIRDTLHSAVTFLLPVVCFILLFQLAWIPQLHLQHPGNQSRSCQGEAPNSLETSLSAFITLICHSSPLGSPFSCEKTESRRPAHHYLIFSQISFIIFTDFSSGSSSTTEKQKFNWKYLHMDEKILLVSNIL